MSSPLGRLPMVAPVKHCAVWYRESNHGIEVLEAASVVQVAQKFEHFLDVYRRPDGSKWSGQDLHDATGGVVPRSYVSNLRKGRIENPGFEKPRVYSGGYEFPA